jgi:magnesium chelatase subunit H
MDGEQKGPMALLKKLRGDRNRGKKRSRLPASARWQCCAGCRSCCASSPARPRTCATTSWPCSTGSRAPTPISPTWCGSWSTLRRWRAPRPCAASSRSQAPVEYPGTGRLSPGDIKGHCRALTSRRCRLKRKKPGAPSACCCMRSYILAGNTGHYDGVIKALESAASRRAGVRERPRHARPAVEQFFIRRRQAGRCAMVSLTGFSLVGGPAYSTTPLRPKTCSPARRALRRGPRDRVPDPGALGRLRPRSDADRGHHHGRHPELDGATGTMVYGGRTENADRRPAVRCDRDAHLLRAAPA